MKLPAPTVNQLTLLAVGGLGLLLALYLGSAVGSGDLFTVIVAVGMIPAFIAFVSLKQMIWVLIPVGWYLTGRLGAVPIPLTVQEITSFAAIAAFMLLVVMRQVPGKTSSSLLDKLVYLNVAYIVFVFVRHPVGFFFFQTDQVGGRAYVSVLMAFGVFLVLSRAKLTPFIAKVWPLLTVVPLLFSSMMEVGARLNPALAPVLTGIYGTPITGGEQAFTVGEQRLTEFQTLGTYSILALVSFYPPLSLITPLYPVRLAMLLVSFAAIFLSGFRLAVIAAGVFFTLSLVIRRHIAGLWIFAASAVAGMILFGILQGSGIVELPLTLQRSLSFLPVEWHPDAKRDAEQSTQWRLDMWRWAWEDNRILRDKVWGQGFGLSLEDMQIEVSARLAGRGEGSGFLGGSEQEWWLINGAFHNGPLSAIRNVGVVGLFLYLALVFVSVKIAWALCAKARGTFMFSMVLFIALPIIWEAFRFIVLYGHYPSTICQSLYWAGLLNLLRNNLPGTPRRVPARADNNLSVTPPVVREIGEPVLGLALYSRSE